MYAYVHKISGAFFEGVCESGNEPLTFRDPPATMQHKKPESL
jgi:hypothetical protein